MQESNKANKFLIISLGQLTHSSIWPSVSAFAQLSSDYSCLPGFVSYPYYYLNTLGRYGYDLYWGGKIESYKLGDIDTNEFKGFLKSQFTSSATNSALTDAWNAMCTMDEKDTANLNALISFLQKHNDVVAIIVSGTNPMQYDYIKDQFGKKEEDGKIVYALSFEKHTLVLKDLAQSALSNLGANSSSKICSFHRDITELTLFDCKVCFIPFNPSIRTLSQELEGASLYINSI